MAVVLALLALVLVVVGLRGRRRRRNAVKDTAAGIHLAGQPWAGPSRMNARPTCRHPASAGLPGETLDAFRRRQLQQRLLDVPPAPRLPQPRDVVDLVDEAGQ